MKAEIRSYARLLLLIICSSYASDAKRCFLLDYSFQPNLLNNDQWMQSLCDHKPLKSMLMEQECSGDDSESHLLLEVDLSSSRLGDDGILRVTQALVRNLPQHPQLQLELKSSTHIGLTLRSSMNGISPRGVSGLIQPLLTHQNQLHLPAIPSHFNLSGTLLEQNISSSGLNFYIHELDFGFNDFSGHHGLTLHPDGHRSNIQGGLHTFLKSVRSLIEDEMGAGLRPSILRLDMCGLGPQFCRSIAKGIVKGASFLLQRNQSNCTAIINSSRHLQLYLSGNEAIGDSGVAALAAALKTASRLTNSQPVIHTLDLSSCGVGDAGAEALANAIEGNPGCIRVLDLSNNKITDEGAASLGRALQQTKTSYTSSDMQSISMDSLNLSNNKHIGDKGLSELASAMAYEALRRLSLRSCSVQADGASAVGKMFSFLSTKRPRSHFSPNAITVEVDLSGNPFGTLHEKEKSTMSSYSASLLKSKASATTASYLNFIGKKIKSGLKDAGLDIEGLITSDSQSDHDDDDEHSKEDEDSGEMSDESEALDMVSKYSSSQCGAKAFADAILDNQDNCDNLEPSYEDYSQLDRHRFDLGMRSCALDTLAYDALASTIIHLRNRHNTDLFIDTELNRNVDTNIVAALRGPRSNGHLVSLEAMSNKYLEARKTMRLARERAMKAAEAAATRLEAEDAISGMMDNVYDESNDDEYTATRLEAEESISGMMDNVYDESNEDDSHYDDE